MKKSGSIKDLAGAAHHEGPPMSLKAIRQGVADHLAADDLRIRRQWHAGFRSPHGQSNSIADGIHRRAHQDWDAGRLRAAVRLMRSAAKQGDSAAMLNTGYFYDVGIGVKKN